MRLFGSKKRKAVTMAVNCLLGAAVFAGGLLADAEVAGAAEAQAKYKNGEETEGPDLYGAIVAKVKTQPLEFYSPDDYPEGGEYTNQTIAGGYSTTDAVENAKVTIHGGTFSKGFFGGFSTGASATGNTVNILGGTIDNQVIGGAGLGGNATGNTVTISGGTFKCGLIVGGIAPGGEATNNTVNITAACDLSTAYIYGGQAGTVSGNTLNISACGIKAYAISAFDNLNFYVPATAVNGDTMLEVVDTATIDGATIKAGVATGSGLKKDDKINLLTAGALSGGAASMKADLTGTGLVEIDGTVKQEDNNIILVMNKDINGDNPGPEPKLKEESKSLVETRAGGMALLNTAFDLTTGKGFANAQAAAEAENNATDDGVTKNTDGVRTQVGFTPYVAVGAANMTYETGSYVDSKGWGINVGFSRIINYQNSKLTLAPFVEYGKASYDSYLENATNTHGSGDNSFTGIGFMAKNEQKDGLYYEGSVRLGRAKGDYQGDASTYGSNYDTASNYLAFHAGIGKVQKLNDKNSIDYYGKLFYTHQNGDTVNIHSTLGDASYDFDAINSYRLRLGARWNQKLGKNDKFYAGLAWDYEFDSEARAHYNGASTPAPSMKGSSGMLELGWKQEATKENPFGVDVGVTGWCGKQRGVQFNAGFSWAF